MPETDDSTTPTEPGAGPLAGAARSRSRPTWLFVVLGVLAALLIAGLAFSLVAGSTADSDERDFETTGEPGDAQLVQTVRNDLPADVGRTLSISPDGASYLSDEGSGEAAIREICVRSVDDHTAQGCTEVGPFFDPRSVTWSADGASLVLGDDTMRSLQGGDVYVMDAASGELTELTADRPREGNGDPDPVIYVFPSISPDASRVAAYRVEQPSREAQLVVFDLASGDEQEIATPPESFNRLIWEPTGTRIWANSGGPGTTTSTQATGYDLGNGEVTTVETTVASERDPDEPAQLVQVSGDGTIGLLALETLRGQEGTRVNQAFSAVIDLRTGERAPLLPHGPDDPDAVDHAGLEAAWLSTDGHYVFTAHFTGPTFAGFLGEDEPPLQLVRISVDSILAGDPEVEILIEDIALETGAGRAVMVTESPTMRLHPVPVADDTMTFPASLPFDGESRGAHPATFIRFVFDRPLS